jgi:hypothetical protein
MSLSSARPTTDGSGAGPPACCAQEVDIDASLPAGDGYYWIFMWGPQRKGGRTNLFRVQDGGRHGFRACCVRRVLC